MVQTTRNHVPKDTVVTVNTGGGGGWGDPLARDPELVLRDVIEGHVSVEGAREGYGVVIANGAVDAAATERLRAERAA